MKHAILSLLLLVILITTVKAQTNTEKRIEFEYGEYNLYELFEFGEKGVLVKSIQDKVKKGLREERYQLYDTNLDFVKKSSVQVKSTFYAADQSSNTATHRHVFQQHKGGFTLLSVDITTMKIKKLEGKLPKKAKLEEMKIMGEYAYFRAEINKNPFLYIINWKTGKQREVPIVIDGIQSKDISLDNLQVLAASNEVFVYANVAIDKKITIVMSLD